MKITKVKDILKKNLKIRRNFRSNRVTNSLVFSSKYQKFTLSNQQKNYSTSNKQKTIAVLGNGISGLSLAHFLQKKASQKSINLKVDVLDKSKRAGGWVHSSYIKDPNTEHNFFFEKGPRSFRMTTDTAIALDLIKEVGLSDRVISPSPFSKNRYIYLNGKLQTISLKSEIFWRLLWPIFKEPWSAIRTNYETQEDESIGSFLERKLGKFATENIATAFVSGIWAGNLHELSLQHNMPFFYKIEKEHGSIFKGMARTEPGPVASRKDEIVHTILRNGGSFSLRGGTQCLANALKNQWLGKEDEVNFLEGNVQKIKHGVTGKLDLSFKQDGGLEEIREYDHIFSTLPAFELSNILVDFDIELSKILSKIPYVSMGLVQVAYAPENPIDLNYQGFGFLASAKDKKPYLGVTFDSIGFPQLNERPKEQRFTIMIGGDKNIHSNTPDPMNLTDDELAQIGIDCLKETLNITTKPNAMLIDRAENCLPQAHVGYQKNFIKPILSHTSENIFNSRLSIGGAFMKGVSMNDCMEYSKTLAENYIEQISN